MFGESSAAERSFPTAASFGRGGRRLSVRLGAARTLFLPRLLVDSCTNEVGSQYDTNLSSELRVRRQPLADRRQVLVLRTLPVGRELFLVRLRSAPPLRA